VSIRGSGVVDEGRSTVRNGWLPALALAGVLAGAGSTSPAAAPAATTSPAGCCLPGEAAGSIGDEIAAVRKIAEDGAVPKGQQDGMTAALSLLAMSEEAFGASRLYLSLERLELARTSIEPIRYLAPRSEAIQKGGAERSNAEVEPLARELLPLKAKLAKPSAPSLPAAVRALRDSARVRAPVLEKTVPMWRDAGEFVGAVYYAGEALAVARASEFYAGLRFPPPPRAPRLPPLGPILDRLEHDLVASYHEPASTEHHRDYILASGALKESRELLTAGLEEGSLLLYLRSRIYAVPLIKAPGATPTLADLQARSDAQREKIASAAADHSIACLYWEKAQTYLERAARGENPEVNLGIAALAIVDVIPEYFRLVEGR